jgi:hypothetical protein
MSSLDKLIVQISGEGLNETKNRRINIYMDNIQI